jgi:arylsulfatase A-like enzyme
MPASKSLLPVARGDASGVRSEAVCCYRNTGIKRDMQYWDPEIHATMIRTGNYKLSVYHTPDHAGFPEKGQLFNVCRDPEERTDLWHAPQQHEIREMLLHRLTSWLSQNDPDFSQLPGTLSAAGPVAED